MNLLLTGQETDRLKFRLLTPDDFDDWMPLFAKKEAATFLGMDSQLSQREMCEKWFEKSLGRYRDKTGGMNVLEDKITGEMIGQCGILIQSVEGETRYEVGYSILPKFWRKGYASEASKKCIDYVFENNVSPNIISIVHVDNIGSEKVARGNGMTIEKSLDDYYGTPVNVFSISKEAWLLNKK